MPEQGINVPAVEAGGASAGAWQQNPAEIDKREIMAIARAVVEKRSYVVKYIDIYNALRDIVEDDDEFHELENKLYDDIVEGRIENVYRFGGKCDDSDCDVVIVTPGELSEKQLKIIEELIELYTFRLYDGDEDERSELTRTLHNLIKMWFSDCRYASSPAEAVYELAKKYTLEIEEEDDRDQWYVGKIYYSIEGIDVRIVKSTGYCTNCVDFYVDAYEGIVGKCTSWRFEDEDE